MQVHRPDFAALIAALEANLPPEPKRAPLVTPPRPRLSRAEEDERYAGDRDETRDLPAPPMQLAAYREPRYIPDFARPAEVVIGIDLGSGDETVVATLAPQSVAPTEWQSGPPPSCGWFNACDEWDRENDGLHFARYWGGSSWSDWVSFDDFEVKQLKLKWFIEDGYVDERRDVQWRGTRLTGADWPEPATEVKCQQKVPASATHISTIAVNSVSGGVVGTFFRQPQDGRNEWWTGERWAGGSFPWQRAVEIFGLVPV